MNGDGYADVIVGAYRYDAGESGRGRGLRVPGERLGDRRRRSRHGAQPSSSRTRRFAQLGASVAGAGDVNGDGYADVIVGAPCYDAGATDEGAAFVFLGSASGIADGDPGTAHAQLESDQAGAYLGRSVAGAGDVNGDGYADVIVGARPVRRGRDGEGAAFVFLGNGDGRPVLARQLRGDVSGPPVQPWGLSHDGNAFRGERPRTHPEGRGRVKLEVEHCEAGLAFADPSCGSEVGASWADVTATSGGVILTETIDGLTSGALYRWRARVLHAPYSVTQSGITRTAEPGARSLASGLRPGGGGGHPGTGADPLRLAHGGCVHAGHPASLDKPSRQLDPRSGAWLSAYLGSVVLKTGLVLRSPRCGSGLSRQKHSSISKCLYGALSTHPGQADPDQKPIEPQRIRACARFPELRAKLRGALRRSGVCWTGDRGEEWRAPNLRHHGFNR